MENGQHIADEQLVARIKAAGDLGVIFILQANAHNDRFGRFTQHAGDAVLVGGAIGRDGGIGDEQNLVQFGRNQLGVGGHAQQEGQFGGGQAQVHIIAGDAAGTAVGLRGDAEQFALHLHLWPRLQRDEGGLADLQTADVHLVHRKHHFQTAFVYQFDNHPAGHFPLGDMDGRDQPLKRGGEGGTGQIRFGVGHVQLGLRHLRLGHLELSGRIARQQVLQIELRLGDLHLRRGDFLGGGGSQQ